MTTQTSAHILIGGNHQKQVIMPASMANRHGMIAGATGTGKTVSLQVLAEGFSDIGVPVFMADVKGDLSGLAKPGRMNDKIQERLDSIKIEGFENRPFPVIFWDLFAKNGHPIRATITDLGPLLLSNLLDLNDTQTGVLYSAFKVADDNGLLLLDLKDLRSLLNWMSENRSELSSEYGNMATSSIGAIQRDLLVLEEQQAEHFFGEPGLKLDDLFQHDFSGQGVISILDVTQLIAKSPRLYATFLLWLMSELFETLPEVGDADKPKMVFFFDEAHLLFDQAPKALLEKIEQVIRLIRSKGVGIYFISQSPLDIPEDILGQLGMKIQHALRAFTPKDQKAVSAVADTFRANPDIDTSTVITELGTGEALVSVLDEDGIPSMVEQILICPPKSNIGPIDDAARQAVISRSPLKGRYDEVVDRESAYEMLKKQTQETATLEKEDTRKTFETPFSATFGKTREEQQAKPKRTSNRQGIGEAFVKSMARTLGTKMGNQIVRGILGSLLGGRR